MSNFDPLTLRAMINISQKTINSKVTCNGVGIHSGANISMTLLPAKCNSGIVFKRLDIGNDEKAIVEARYDNVVDTKLGTTIANKFGTKVSTIEHFMAALWGCGIDNLIIELNAPELPIMDGSSEPYVFLIECAGINTQEEARQIVEVTKKVRVEEDDKFIEVEPAKDFAIDLHIDFNHDKIRNQKFSYNSSFTSFKNDISRARTFGFKHEIDYLHKIGLAKGGSLDNAILLDENGIVNEEGLRYSDEFVRHKTLDFIGDIYLAGKPILGHFNASKTGHSLNNKLLHKLFEDQSSWKIA